MIDKLIIDNESKHVYGNTHNNFCINCLKWVIRYIKRSCIIRLFFRNKRPWGRGFNIYRSIDLFPLPLTLSACLLTRTIFNEDNVRIQYNLLTIIISGLNFKTCQLIDGPFGSKSNVLIWVSCPTPSKKILAIGV